MLERTLIEHCLGALYSDQLLADFSWKYLNSPNANAKEEHRLVKEFFGLYSRAIDNRNPGRYRVNELEAIVNIKDEAPWNTNELPWLDCIFEQLMVRHGDFIHYRDLKVQAYTRLAAQLDPKLLVAWHLSGSLDKEPLKESDIERIISSQSYFFAPPSSSDKPFADGHVHYGGVGGGIELLSTCLFESEQKVIEDYLNTPALDVYKSTLSQLRGLFYTLIQKICDLVLDNPFKTLDELLKNNMSSLSSIKQDWGNLWKSCAFGDKYSICSAGWFMGKFAQSIKETGNVEWLWFFTALCKHYRVTKDKKDRAAILCWFQVNNLLQSEVIMNGNGLKSFTNHYFFHPVRSCAKTNLSKLPALFSGRNDLAEIKIAPDAFGPEFVTELATKIAEYSNVKVKRPPYIFADSYINPNDNAQYIKELERWHFCCHFSRTNNSSYPKEKKIRESWDSAENLLRELSTEDGWSKRVFLGGRNNKKLHFQPNRWVRGFDVAGDENALSIEWFAPILRWLRRGFLPGLDSDKAHLGFHLSIHAGEDYSHPLTGLRKVDETVTFCEMREGDRLGHALALGIEPEEWVDRQGQVLLPLDEHLDNLVWFWHYATILSPQLSIAMKCLPTVERRIAKLSSIYNKILFESCEPISPSVLFEAWSLRKNCRFTHRKCANDSARTLKEMVAVPDIELFNPKKSELQCYNPVALYLQRHKYIENHLWKTRKMPMVLVTKCNSKFNNSVELRSKEALSDTESCDELLLMAAIQDYLLTEYDSRGIIIEANPTSNLYIARLQEHKEHPIFRWCGPDRSLLDEGKKYNRFGLRRGPIRALVNTDDPGIMPTTLRTEFSLLREAAIELGIGRSDVERWLEELRGYGVEQFQKNHLPVFSSME